MLPKIKPFSFGEEPSFVGDSNSIQCSLLHGDLPVAFSWMLNGKVIPADLNINVGSFGKKTSVINIDSIKAEHAGNYTCLASNRGGMSFYSTELAVKGI